MIRAAVIEAIHAYEKHSLRRLTGLVLPAHDFDALVTELSQENGWRTSSFSSTQTMLVLGVEVHRGAP